jgi:hypothetical protein
MLDNFERLATWQHLLARFSLDGATVQVSTYSLYLFGYSNFHSLPCTATIRRFTRFFWGSELGADAMIYTKSGKDHNGDPPLIVALDQGNVEMMRLLLNYSADTNGTTSGPPSPIAIRPRHFGNPTSTQNSCTTQLNSCFSMKLIQLIAGVTKLTSKFEDRHCHHLMIWLTSNFLELTDKSTHVLRIYKAHYMAQSY